MEQNLETPPEPSEKSEISYEPEAIDFLPTVKEPPFGFEMFPKAGSAWVPNLLMSFIFISCVLHWSGLVGESSYFVASRDAVFGDGEYWRLLTALGGHGDLMHLLHNAPIFWFFCWILQGYFGWIFSLCAVLVIGILSNAVTVWFYEDRMRLLGASGMVYGMVALWLVLYIRFDHKGWWVKRVMRSLGFSLLVLFPQTYEPNVSYLAHASGFAIGLILALAMIPVAQRVAPVLTDPYYRRKIS